MNDLFALQNEFAPALLSTLIHSVWTGGIIYLVLRLYLDSATAHDSTLRYVISVLTLVLHSVLTLLLFCTIYDTGSQVLHLPTAVSVEGNDMAGLSGSREAAGQIGGMRVSEVALLLYLAGVLIFSFRLFLTSMVIRNRIRVGREASQQYTGLLERARIGLGISRRIRLVISEQLQSPALYGFFKPVIIVPAGMFTHLSFEQVEVILLHELIHLKKADFLVNLFQQFVESLLFFNPFTWMISRRIREEREKRVDDCVTEYCNAATYAKALFNLSLLHTGRLTASLAATSGGQKLLLNRIQRILKSNQMKKVIRTRIYLTAIVTAGAILVITLSGFSSSLLQINRQQTKAVQSISLSDSGENIERNQPELAEITGSATFQAVNKSQNSNDWQLVEISNIKQELNDTRVLNLSGQDTLTEQERKEMLKALEHARKELEAIDWEQELSQIEEERARLMAELPARLKEEQIRIKEELSRINKEMIRKEMESARRHLDSARQQIDMDALQQQFEEQKAQLEIQRKQLEAKIQAGDFPDEETRAAMEQSLEAIREIDFQEILTHMEEALSDMDMDVDFNYDMDIELHHDSMLIEAQKNLQEIDVERIKQDVERSIRKLEMQIEELKSTDTIKKQKK